MIDPKVRGRQPSATLAINQRSKRLMAEGREVFCFGLGQSPFPVPPNVAAALANNANQKDYLPVSGLPDLRQAVAAYHASRHNVPATPEQVVIGPGSKQLLFLTQLACDYELALPSPSWVSYAPQAEMLGKRIHWIETQPENGWRLLPTELEAAARRAGSRLLLLLNYPNNPTGQTYPVSWLQDLATVARTHGVVILSDEIYGELEFAGAHSSIAEFYPEGTVLLAGLSKWCGAGGWRLGTAVFGEDLSPLRDAVISCASETHTAVSAPLQHASVTAFRGGPVIEDYLARSRFVLKTVLDHAYQQLQAVLVDLDHQEEEWGPHLDRGQGGFYLLLRIGRPQSVRDRRISSSPELCERLLSDTGVASLPGSAFGRPPQEMSLRISLVDFDGGAALQHAEGMDSARVLACCSKQVEGVNRLCEWIRR